MPETSPGVDFGHGREVPVPVEACIRVLVMGRTMYADGSGRATGGERELSIRGE